MNKPYRFFANENVIALLIGIVVSVAYITTMCSTISFIDSGELATVASTLSIAHPTGYPLFTLLGRCAVMSPINTSPIVKLNFLAALFTAIAIGLFFKTTILLDRSHNVFKFQGKNNQPNAINRKFFPASIGALTLAFSSTVWAQSVDVEVYSLHLLFLVLTMWALVKGIEEQLEDGNTLSRFLILFSFLFGLGFTNHLTMILVIPAFGYLYFSSFGKQRNALLRLGKLLPFSLLGLSTYLYLPIRSSSYPPLNWGHPAQLERLFWHVSGKQYRSWMFSGFQNAEKQFNYFINHFPSEFHWVVIGILLMGVWQTFQRSRKLFFFLLIAFASCLAYSINYDIHDIDSYFLLAYIVSGFFVVSGLNLIFYLVERRSPVFAMLLGIILLISLPLIQFSSNKKGVDESNNFLVEDYTRNILQNLKTNAVVFSYQWDYFVAPSLYYQIVQKERPDVVIIDKELLRRSWYFIELEKRYPRLIQQSYEKVQSFLKELYKFEHGEPYNPAVIESRYVEMINDFIDKSKEQHPVYVGPEIEPEFGSNYQRIPAGLLFQLASTGEQMAFVPPKMRYRQASIESRLTAVLRFNYIQMLLQTAVFLNNQKQFSDAILCLDIIQQVDPTFQPARQLRSQIQSRQTSN
ncbi:MAG: DUF2723 domain-containing protein [Ignavibacteriales bacterium]|nr:DUF2723 domain-containing protein [Ignavibacteriales bacterium]